jgi:dTDP-4-dehydrorhamnose reductase
MKESRVLVLGVSGLLGNVIFRLFKQESDCLTFGSARSSAVLDYVDKKFHSEIITAVEVENYDSLVQLFATVKPDVVINCIGIVKQLSSASDALVSIPINSLLPHRLANLCLISNARFVHISTDCVFSGSRGNYLESDLPDAEDMYGRSKLMGEVDYPNAITLRTSIIGHEITGTRSLISWFLAQQGNIKGYKKAIFSGLPTVEIARIIRDFILPNPSIHGVYHLSADPISKYDLLCLVAETYEKSIDIVPDSNYTIDRSLNSKRFRSTTGFIPKPWGEMIQAMYDFDCSK